MLLRSSLVRRASPLTRSLSGAIARAPRASRARLPVCAPFSSSAAPPTPGSPMPAVAIVRYSPLPSAAVERTSIPTPSPKPHELLIRITATTINPIDADIATGYGAAALEAMRGPLPVVAGREGVGIVEQVGSAVWDYAPGDRVWFAPSPVQTPAAHAKYISVPRSSVSIAPKNLTDAEAASLPYSSLTAWAALVDVAGVIRPDTSPSAALGSQLPASAGLSGSGIAGAFQSAASAVSSAASAAASGGGIAAAAASLLSSLSSAAAGPAAFAANAAATAAAASPAASAAAATVTAAAAGASGKVASATTHACHGAAGSAGKSPFRRGPFTAPTAAAPAAAAPAAAAPATAAPAAPAPGPAAIPSPSSPSAPRVLIHGGSGPLGLFATRLLALHGAQVAVTCAPRNAAAAKGAGAGWAVDYRGAQWDNLGIEWAGAANGDDGKADVLLDCVGESPATLSLAVKRGGTIVSVHSLLKDFNSGGDSSSSGVGAAAGILSGAISTAASFSSASAAASARGVRFLPAFFRPNGDALKYLARLAEAGVAQPTVDVVVDSVEEGFRVFEGRRKEREAEGKTVEGQQEEGVQKKGRRGGKVVIVPTWE